MILKLRRGTQMKFTYSFDGSKFSHTFLTLMRI
jgi:hypothetical protein